jgi:hypothetical protein
MDYGRKYILKEIKIEAGKHTWMWISFDSQEVLDISNLYNNNKICSFDNAINRSINDLYCTVYEFDNFDEMIKNWNKIRYESNITTTYKGEKNKK